MDSSSSSLSLSLTSPSLSGTWEYDVFPSFHGADVRKNVLDTFVKEFTGKGIKLFIDDSMERGESIGLELKRAIRGSKISVVLLSKNYASSSWCLDELVEIMKQESGQTVIPIFYKVDPTDVRKQMGRFGKVFEKTCKGKDNEKTKTWSKILEDVTKIAGYHSTDWHDETSMMKKIAVDILGKLNDLKPSLDLEVFTGLETHMENIKQLLSLDSNEVRMIGIWGPSGKTTIAKLLFNELSNRFQNSALMENIKCSYQCPKPCFGEYEANLQLQNEMMSQMTKQSDIVVNHLGVAQERLKNRKVLLVLEEVDRLGQLDALAGNVQWFGPGSRIIVTSEDLRLLRAAGMNHTYMLNYPSTKHEREPDISSAQRESLRHFDSDNSEEVSSEGTDSEDEAEPKRRPRKAHFSESASSHTTVRESRTIVLNDGYRWHKYRQKYVKGNLNPRTYFKCTTEGCRVKKHVERSATDPKALLTTYKGEHNHDPPAVKSSCHDVIIRYEREDISVTNFVSHLHASLRRRGISVYEESNEVDAIPECRLLIILLTSTYVPGNLLNILEQQHTENLVVYPIFYRLSPHDFGSCKNYQRFLLQDEAERWQASLVELNQMHSYTLTDKSEYDLIDEIVRDALEVLCSGEKVNMTGMHMQVEEILSLLCIESLDVRNIGIWGTVGIGKTTIAEAIFHRISAQYETSVFFKDLHTQVKEKGLYAVREDFFSKVLAAEPHLIRISDIKTSFLRSRLQRKRVFVVLDDVNDYRDVETCLGTLSYFGPGSRIIMTSRNRCVFELCKINNVYEVKPLDIPNSLQVLHRGTFQTVLSPEISLELVKYANGNPQVLQFLSSSVRQADRLSQEDQQSFPIYIPCIFERSCCGLDDNEMGIFLDMACFFRRMNKDNVAMLLDGCGFFAHVGFRSLVDKSLLIISHNMVDMLTFIQATGREIVRRESSDRPGDRSRLWNAEDIRDVFVDDTGTSAIEGIFLDMSKLSFDANPNIFEKMCNLRLLKLYWSKEEKKNGVSFPQGLEYLPRKLRLLHWEHYPLRSLPRSFNPENLVELNLSSSCVTKLWKGKKNLEKLRKMRLSFSNQLTKIPRLSSATNLEHIDLEGCNSLLRISQSISCLKKLAFLNLKDCSKLESIPSTVDLESLEVLNLSGCSKLENFPEISPNLKELYMGGTVIQEIPSSIKDLVLLEKLDLENSKHLKNLPTSICKLKHLETLNLSGCTNLDRFPDLSRKMRSLRFLDLSRTAIQELPSSISNLIALEELRFVDCRNLVK